MKFKPVLLHFKFDNFADLPSGTDDATESEVQTDCNGHEWWLSLYPGGDTRNKEPGWVGLYLCSQNDDSLDTKFTLLVKDSYGATVKEYKNEYNFVNEKGFGWGWGESEIMQRSTILNTANNILRDGALYIDVVIQVKIDNDHLFLPPSEHSNNLLNLFATGEKSDTSLHVGGKVFRVHSLIIHANAPLLANHCDGNIIDATPEVFQLILEHIYSGRQPTSEKILEHDKELIDTSNKYELTQLKMSVENVLVRERIITNENVVDYILFADAQSCALLKEYAISFFLMNHREILKSEHSKCLKDSGELMTEIMMLMNPRNEDDETMTVNELRKELGKLELNVDGSKETLVSRLEEAKRQRSD